MAVSLKRALMEILTDWPHDLPSEWRDACGEVELGFGNADPRLEFRGRCYRCAELVEWLRARAMTALHLVGTCKMGKDVFDARLKVRSVDWLCVADASAVPTISSGNTNAPAIMICEKCAELILEEAA
jgi:choline dehydrogenase-like flavoprotein